ncbi:MAG: 2-iminoacetate synthase ThiH [Sphingobacteriales bacterium]|jgi:2-iminoacetate synthase|nr:MAG: 2-iminoacetate synthase ThiH [Sphingobacteriales bacterium]
MYDALQLFKHVLDADKIELQAYLEKSKQLTRERFGNTIQLFAPLYLSNECQNICTYCGFSLDNKLKRKTLTDNEILEEAKVLKSLGFDAVLLVTGEDYRVDTQYIINAIKLLKPYFAQISIEVQPLEYDDYVQLKSNGVYAVLVYQETYNKNTYKLVHPKGKKANFEYRLSTPEKIGKAEIYKIGLGVLFGLDTDWKQDAIKLAEHIILLSKKYWKSKFSVSFPRIRPHEGEFQPNCELTEIDLLRLIAAFRLTFPDIEIILSTRERAEFRDIAMPYGITTMSAGSKTAPGEYHQQEDSLQQFEISDDRTPNEVAILINHSGLEVIWKDWDYCLV